MATLPYDGSVWVILPWPYTNAEHPVPAGFTRDDTHADRFLQGHATAGGSNGGGTHTHTFSHTHPDDIHTHSVSLTTADGNTAAIGQRSGSGTNFAAGTVTNAHTHSSVTSSSGTQTYQTDSSATTASTSEPAFAEAIFIRPDDASQQVPQYAVAFYDQTTVPAGFALADGNAESQDMGGKFIKGATAASDPGADGGGGNHTHTYNHDHDIDTHSHTPGVQSGPASQSTRVTTAITITLTDDETHDVELPVGGGGTTGSRSPTLSNKTYEPAHTELLAIERTAAGQDLPDGLIVAFTGDTTDLAAFPDWTLCDGDGGTLDLTASQIKMTTGTGRIGTVGGSDNQDHTIALPHNHAVTAHTHIGGLDGDIDFTITSGSGTRTVYSDIKHVPSHGQTVGTAVTLAANAMAGDTSSVDSRPPFRTVLWIKRVVPATVHIKGGAIKGGALAA